MNPRLAFTLLVATVAVLAAANLVVWRAAHAARHTDADAPWGQWQRLAPEQRAARVRQYLEIARDPDAEALFRRAREFARLSPPEQVHRRRVAALIREIIAAEPPAARRELLSSPERARAYRVYRLLEGRSPERLAELRRTAPPDRP